MLCHYQQYCTYWYGCRLFIYQEWQTIVLLGDLLQDIQERSCFTSSKTGSDGAC